MFLEKIDRSHITLSVLLVIALITLAIQATTLRDAQNDVARFKQVGVWAWVHSQHEFVRYVRERNSNEETLRKYLTREAMQALAAPPLSGSVSKIPADPPVDSAALQEVLAIAASGRW